MFAKVFGQIFDSSIAEDYNCRRMFMDLLVLAGPDGVVDMTLEAIVRRTNVPIEEVSKYIEELQRPDPSSRSKQEEGRRIIPIDPERGWGWKIVNYRHYRQLRDQEARRSYFREEKRKQRSKNKKQTVQDTRVDNGGRCQIVPSSSTSSLGEGMGEGFVQEWENFIANRKEMGHPMTKRAEELILDTLRERPAQATAGLRCAIKNNWRGFEWDWFDKKTGRSNGQAEIPKRKTQADVLFEESRARRQNGPGH